MMTCKMMLTHEALHDEIMQAEERMEEKVCALSHKMQDAVSVWMVIAESLNKLLWEQETVIMKMANALKQAAKHLGDEDE